MAEAALPEEIVVNIISRLPVKSLLRFTSVSKRWRSTILFDPHFANQLRINKTLNIRLLVSSEPESEDNGLFIYKLYPPPLETLDLETTSSRRLNFPFERPGGIVSLLGSCNGLVFVAHHNVYYVYNPITEFVEELPDLGTNAELTAYGVGYLPATNDYKVIVCYAFDEEEEEIESRLYQMITLKDQIWRSIEGPKVSDLEHKKGTLINEALHWLHCIHHWTGTYQIEAFDLGKEEFRKIQLPDFGPDGKLENYLGVCFGGCLCVARYATFDCDSMDFWVMREYRVSESWTKLYHMRFSNPQSIWPLLITENYTVALIETAGIESRRRVRISHKQEEGEEEPSLDILQGNWSEVIEYEESLVSIKAAQRCKEKQCWLSA